MHISSLKQSKFLTRGDVRPDVLAVIEDVFQENVAKEGAPEELKWCISFVGVEKPMVLNQTNIQIIAQVTGSEETDQWKGKKIVLYDDPNVSYAGKLVGGIRCRAPRNQPAAGQPARRAATVAPATPPPPVDPGPATPEDDVPF